MAKSPTEKRGGSLAKGGNAKAKQKPRTNFVPSKPAGGTPAPNTGKQKKG